MAMAMVAYLVVAYTAAGAVGVAALGIARTVPVALVAPLAGVLSTRASPERVLVAAYVARIAMALLAALAVALGLPLVAVFAAAALSAAAGALIRPLHNGILPSVAQTPRELIAANVATSTGDAFGTLVGPVVGGLLVATAGAAATFTVAAGVALAAALLAGSARATANELPRRSANARAALDVGVQTLRSRRGAALIVLGFGAQTVVRGALTTLMVVASFELLNLGDAGVGSLSAAIGVGALIGAVGAIGSAGRHGRLAKTFCVALAGWGLPIAFIGLWPLALVAFVALAIVGLSNARLDVAGFTLLQRTVPPAARVPVLGLVEGVVGLGVALGSLASPFLIDAFGIRGALLATGAILPIVALLLWPALSRVPDIAIVPEQQLSTLQRVTLFESLPLGSLEELARAARDVGFVDGELLMREGDVGDRYLVIRDGFVEVTQDGHLLRAVWPRRGRGRDRAPARISAHCDRACARQRERLRARS